MICHAIFANVSRMCMSLVYPVTEALLPGPTPILRAAVASHPFYFSILAASQAVI